MEFDLGTANETHNFDIGDLAEGLNSRFHIVIRSAFCGWSRQFPAEPVVQGAPEPRKIVWDIDLPAKCKSELKLLSLMHDWLTENRRPVDDDGVEPPPKFYKKERFSRKEIMAGGGEQVGPVYPGETNLRIRVRLELQYHFKLGVVEAVGLMEEKLACIRVTAAAIHTSFSKWCSPEEVAYNPYGHNILHPDKVWREHKKRNWAVPEPVQTAKKRPRKTAMKGEQRAV